MTNGGHLLAAAHACTNPPPGFVQQLHSIGWPGALVVVVLIIAIAGIFGAWSR